MKRMISPSILSADFGNLQRDIEMLNRSEAQWIHVDVMDGVFVPNISFGFPVMETLRRTARKFLDVHLMIVEPGKYAARFAEAGADLVTFHAEAAPAPRDVIRQIREAGALAGISVKPATPVEVVEELLPELDLVLIMSVEPGFGGQSFIESSWDKVRRLRRMIDGCGAKTLIEIDGGVSGANAAGLYEAGCDVLVAGSAVFRAANPEAEIARILSAKQ